MSDELKDLTPAQARDLETIHRASKGGEVWCKVDSFHLRVIDNLVAKHLIDAEKNPDGVLVGRVTAKAARLLNPTPTPPSGSPHSDGGSGQERSFKVRSFEAAEPMEREVTHENDAPKVKMGPYPKPHPQPPGKAPGQDPPHRNGEGRTTGPRAPVVPDSLDFTHGLDPERKKMLEARLTKSVLPEAETDCGGECVHARVLGMLRSRGGRLAEVIEKLLDAEELLDDLGG